MIPMINPYILFKIFLYYFCRQMGLNPNEIAPKNGITLEMENQGINKVGF